MDKGTAELIYSIIFDRVTEDYTDQGKCELDGFQGTLGELMKSCTQLQNYVVLMPEDRGTECFVGAVVREYANGDIRSITVELSIGEWDTEGYYNFYDSIDVI
jgi:hypothetical protein